jgi:hypothetical protein
MKKTTRKLSLTRETLLRFKEVQFVRAEGGLALVSGETNPTDCKTEEMSSCCPPGDG